MAESEGGRNFHLNSDVDSSKFAQHHTIGTKYGQAAPGEGYASLKAAHEALVEEFEAYKARIGSTTYYGGTATTSLPNNPANPYTSISGFTNEWGDQPAGLQYQGLGIFECTADGAYLVEFNAGLASSAAGRRILFWFKNGTVDEYRRLNDNAGLAISTVSFATTMRLVAGDEMHLRFFQDSGAALNMIQTGNLIDDGTDWSRMITISVLR